MLNEENSRSCRLDNCPIMLRILPPAYDLILPQARQEIYFCNRIGQNRPVATVSNWPILLKKSAMVSTAEKHASEIEILTLAEAS